MKPIIRGGTREKLLHNSRKCCIKRPGNLVARYGGEEFAVILPNTDTEGATHVADKICHAVRTLAIPHQAKAAGRDHFVQNLLATQK
ncbi:diguanylate cyclase [Nostoc sp. BAE]|nr:diguanylate cyclase [Nostoc commune]MBG1258722.1 diguanylate cyclase [Nostoc commune BAE]